MAITSCFDNKGIAKIGHKGLIGLGIGIVLGLQTSLLQRSSKAKRCTRDGWSDFYKILTNYNSFMKTFDFFLVIFPLGT